MKKYLIKHLTLALLFVLCGLSSAVAQKGNYVGGAGMLQSVSLSNSTDMRNPYLDSESTWTWGGGLVFTHNFEDNFGIQTGFYYSRQGQQYSGEEPLDESQNVLLPFESNVEMDFLKVPLLFGFNNSLDAGEYVFLSIYFGLQLDLLYNARFSSSHEFQEPEGVTFDPSNVFRQTSASLVGSVIFNVRLNDNWYGLAGFKLDRTLGDFERKDFNFPEDAPQEWKFPLGTPKTANRTFDPITRATTRNVVAALTLGIVYKFGGSE